MRQETRAIRVLLVEDDVDDAELMKARFADAGLRVEMERVESSPTFRAALARGDTDVVLADYSLPRLDGVAVLELARELRPDIPVVLISGVISEDLALETLKLGATDYVLKQRLDRLVPVVLRVLRERQERHATLEELDDAISGVRESVAALDGDIDGPRTEVSAQSLALLRSAVDRLTKRMAWALGEPPRA